MNRAAPVVLGILAMIAGGCPEEPTPAADGSSTGGSGDGPSDAGSGTALGSSSDGVDETTVGTTIDPTTTDDSTTGVESSGQARFVVRERIPDNDYFDLVLHEYADGVLAAPQSLTPDLPAGGGVQFNGFADSGRAMAYCPFDPGQDALPCLAVDLASHPPGPGQSLVAGAVPADSLLAITTFVEATESFVFRAVDPAGVVPSSVFVAPFPGGELQLPQPAVEVGPTDGIDSTLRVRADGAWVGYVVVPDTGPRNAFIAPLPDPDPGAAMMVSDLVDPALRASPPTFVPGQEVVLYTVDDAMPGPTDDSLWFVDISGPMPSAPLRVDDPLADALDVRGPQIAPDGHALLYWVGVGGELEGDLMLVDLSTGVPGPPQLVSTLGAEQTLVVDFGWSPDSRLVVYLAAHQQPDAYDVHVVDASGGTLGEPMLATGGIMPGSSVELTFDDASTWLYYVAQQDVETAQLYRVDVSGAEPGVPQRVSGDAGWATGEIIGSPDWGMVLYTAQQETGDLELFLVDVSGPEPGEAVRINAPLAEGVTVAYGARFSRDGSVVLYGERGPDPSDPTPVRLVDLASLQVLLVSDDALGVFPIVD